MLVENAPQVRTLRNPVIRGFHPDPSICRVGEDYYLAVSSFEYFPAVPLFHSRDLAEWTPIGHAIDRQEQLNFRARPCSQGIFAPTIRHHNGTFYLVTTDVGGIGNFLLTATDPCGDWSDPVLIDRSCFDPSLFFDDDGRVYYTRGERGSIVQAELDVVTGQLLSGFKLLTRGFSSNDSEGPHLYKVGKYYYLLCAEGGTGHGHMITIGRSDNPWGPFESCPHNPVLTHRHLIPHPIRYTGHGDLIEAHDGSWWVVFLGTRHDPRYGYNFHVLGRETFLAPVKWENGWPVVNEGRPVLPEMQVLAFSPNLLPARPVTASPCEWVYLREYPGQAHVQFFEGGVNLTGKAVSLDVADCPAAVFRRQEEFCFRALVDLEFSPQNVGEEAGLVVLLSNEFYASVCFRLEEDGLWLQCRRRLMDISAVTFKRRWDASTVHFRVEGNQENYQFLVGEESKPTQRVDVCPLRFLSTELATGWTGVMIGLYATGNGSACSAPARFRNFTYQNLTSCQRPESP